MNYGDEGPGEWITIYANPGHIFMVVAGLRFDTSGRGRRRHPLAGGRRAAPPASPCATCPGCRGVRGPLRGAAACPQTATFAALGRPPTRRLDPGRRPSSGGGRPDVSPTPYTCAAGCGGDRRQSCSLVAGADRGDRHRGRWRRQPAAPTRPISGWRPRPTTCGRVHANLHDGHRDDHQHHPVHDRSRRRRAPAPPPRARGTPATPVTPGSGRHGRAPTTQEPATPSRLGRAVAPWRPSRPSA